MEVVMAADVSRDQLALIRIEGMHCHKCEHAIRKALTRHPGVHEVEVDFPSGQASVLYDRGAVTVRQLMESVNEAGYHATGFTQQDPDQTTHPGTADASTDA
jgi:Cu+-exporting ATPase